ncbi:MAG: ribonuclease HII [Candidatus Kerfeldbacteria bacterium]|nr:ribonuclease HII [Candidatus Kerfeldbacteria bacterium]
MKPSWRYEQKLWRQGYSLVAGVDEVGRGAWAGPVVAAAVVIERAQLPHLRKLSWWNLVNDSKLVAPSVRQRIFSALGSELVWALGVVNNKAIDQIGLAAANRRAVHLAVSNLKIRPDYVLADYVAKLGQTLADAPAWTVVDGDSSIFSIALASIVAKVSRDRLMASYDKKYPGYGFAAHKGYGTAEHRQALGQLGISPIHRRSYRPVQERLSVHLWR